MPFSPIPIVLKALEPFLNVDGFLTLLGLQIWMDLAASFVIGLASLFNLLLSVVTENVLFCVLPKIGPF